MLIHFDVRMLCVINMLVLLVVFVRHVGISKMFTSLDELDCLKLSTSLGILLCIYPSLV